MIELTMTLTSEDFVQARNAASLIRLRDAFVQAAVRLYPDDPLAGYESARTPEDWALLDNIMDCSE